MVTANYRRIEADAMTAWALGQISVKNPQDGSVTTVGLQMSASRYTTAATAWNDPTQNAYNNLMTWLDSATDLVGPIVGVMLRRATLLEIKADAPPAIPGGTELTMRQLEDRIEQERGSAFRFVINEDSLDFFTDGGLEVVRTKVWPSMRIAAIPEGETVGFTAFAPVVRAYELSRNAPTAGIDVRGQTVFYEQENGGRHLTVEAQVNALPVPNEQRIAVINVGV
jgi:hypothetical protein